MSALCHKQTGYTSVSNLAAVVGPVQQSLALPRPTCRVAGLAVPLDLRDVPPDGLPSSNLPRILLRDTPPHVIAAVPLKPAPWIVGMDPTFPAPDRERLAGVAPPVALDASMNASDVVGVVVSALGGAAVGLERQWSGHAEGPSARFAGIRTFAMLGIIATIYAYASR